LIEEKLSFSRNRNQNRKKGTSKLETCVE